MRNRFERCFILKFFSFLNEDTHAEIPKVKYSQLINCLRKIIVYAQSKNKYLSLFIKCIFTCRLL